MRLISRAALAVLAVPALSAIGLPAMAEVPRVVTDIVPVQSLVAQVMGDLGEPAYLIEPGASPHHYALKPSDAMVLSQARVIFWVGDAESPWLSETVETLAPDAVKVELLDVPGTMILQIREGEGFSTHSHGAAEHEDHGHSDAGRHDDPAGHSDEHAPEDQAGQAEHEEGHHHTPGSVDPHAWLDPENGRTWLAYIAETLAKQDPDNARTYRDNAARASESLVALEAEIAGHMEQLPGGFITFHDAYQYFEHRFQLPARGSLAATDASDPGPARVAALRARVTREGVTCLFSEPQFNPRQVATLASDLNLRTGVLDPIGAQIPTGPELYGRLMRGIADGLMVCLKGE